MLRPDGAHLFVRRKFTAIGLRQGFLETSNVQPINEMVQLMDTMRRFEAEQHFVRGYDGMVDEAIKTLGKI